jgi:CCR4-NOT transcriptional regulation complex NOT5 subunit
MQGGCLVAPTKPKGRPKKNSIPTFGLTFDTAQLLAAAAAAGVNPAAKAGSSRISSNHLATIPIPNLIQSTAKDASTITSTIVTNSPN